MELIIDSKLKQASGGRLALGTVSAHVRVRKHDEDLWAKILQATVETQQALTLEKLVSLQQIAALRTTYKALGKEPQRYRGSNEALLRRVLKGQGLYQVNNVVDVNNLISLTSRRSCGSYDLSQLSGRLVFGVGVEDAKYRGIGKEEINISGLPVFCDDTGPFGSPTSDSERAMIRPKSEKVLLVIIAFDGDEGLTAQMESAVSLLVRFCEATNIFNTIIR